MVNDAKTDGEKSGNPRELYWIPVLAGAFAVLVAVAAMYALAPEPESGPAGRAESFEGLGGDFTLTAHTGAPVSLADFRGKIVLVYFGFTYCPDVCPVHLTLISAALDRLGARANRIQPLFVSVDPARDTPDQMALYVRNFAPSLIGLTGSEAEIEAMTADYAVAREIVGDPAGDDYTVNHSSVIYVIGREGEIIDLLNPDMTPEQLADQLRRYL